MPLNKIYLLRDIQTYDGQNVENIYFFNHVAGSGNATSLVLAFEGQILPKIVPIQMNTLTHTGISAYNLGDLSDFASLPLVTTGTNTLSDGLPAFNAVGFTFKRSTRAVRDGSKRIAGVPEGVASQGHIIYPDYLSLVEALRLQFAANLVDGDDTWQHVIVKRVKVANPVGSKRPYKYLLPVSDAQLVYSQVAAVTFDHYVTSQVSRK